MDNWELPGQIDGENCTVIIGLHSPGVWNLKGENGFLDYALPRLLLQLAVIFLVTHALHAFFKRLYLPRMISEIMSGVILGKTVMGRMFPNLSNSLFLEDGKPLLDNLSKIGFIFFMFLIGVKISPSMVFKTGRKPWILGVSVVFFPIIVCVGITSKLDYALSYYWRESIRNVIRIQTLTPFPVVAALLTDLEIMNFEIGRLALASTLISDFIGQAFQIFYYVWRLSYEGWYYLMWTNSLVSVSVLCLVIVFVIHPFCLWIIKKTPEGKSVDGSYIIFFSSIVLIASIISVTVGVEYHFAPFILGLSVPAGPPLGSTLVTRMNTLISGLLAPLFMTYCSLRVDLFLIYDFSFLGLLWSIITTFFMVKLGSIFFPALLCKVGLRDAIALSFIMSSQGIVQLGLYGTVFKSQTIDDVAFSTGMILTALMATITCIVVRLSCDFKNTYAGYQKRNILHTPYNSELRLLACSHRQDDALAAINLIEMSNISKESPVAAYALNLVEMVGQATPLLINHQLGQKVSSYGCGSRSQQIMDVFYRFHDQYSGMLNIQLFTSVSLPMFMHQDICSLAFDKLMSLIILPFHRKWNQRGKLIFDNSILRGVNLQVMQNAPCSVGILVERRKIHNRPSTSQPMYSVGVIFLGGFDDREALAYGKRMANSSNVHLTVVRIVGRDNGDEGQWDTVLDIETLKDLKQKISQQNNVVYREQKAEDGSDTTLIINAMTGEFDLIMVGRNHKKDSVLLSGLSEWSEFPELGPIGDVLASSDIKKPVSVLVVQQQQEKNK